MTRADSLHAQIAAMRERVDADKCFRRNPAVYWCDRHQDYWHAGKDNCPSRDLDLPKLLAAVEAVVGLHEPYNYEGRRVVISRNGRERWVPHTYILCAGCEANSHGEYSTDWPCPTITALTSALGVDDE